MSTLDMALLSIVLTVDRMEAQRGPYVNLGCKPTGLGSYVRKDCIRSHHINPIKSPMSTCNVTMLSGMLTVDHIEDVSAPLHFWRSVSRKRI